MSGFAPHLGPAPARLAFVACSAWACGTTDIPVFRLTSGLNAPDSGAVADASPASAPPTLGTLEAFCASSGPPVLVDSMADGGPTTTCPDQLAQRAFRYALCTCGDYVSDHALVTDAFNGASGPYDPSMATAGGSVVVNGSLNASGAMRVGGSLWEQDPMAFTTATVSVAGDLHAQGEMHPAPDVSVQADALSVQADAWLARGLQTTGSVAVRGTLHVPAGQPIDVAAHRYGTQDTATDPDTPACDCDRAHLVDVAGIVATYRASQASEGGASPGPTDLLNAQTDVTETLECGRYVLDRIMANRAVVTLRAHGRVALFVGNISVDDLEIDVPQASEFDLFVSGNVDVRGALRFGTVANPGHARMYVGGTVNLRGVSTVAGSLYVPLATLLLGPAAQTTVYGAIFAYKFNASAKLDVHYDSAVLTQSSTPACVAP